MIVGRPRVDLESALARALSRYIGYTTGAYDLDRIVSTVDAFEASSSVYVSELIARLRSRALSGEGESASPRAPDDAYLSEVLHFAEALSIIEGVSPKEARVRRYAPTERGRALRGARASEDRDFYRFFLTRIVLLADADALFPILEYYCDPSSASLQEHYCAFHATLRKRRIRWLMGAFPEPILLSRIAKRIPWLRPQKDRGRRLHPDVLSMTTARHHTTPRRGWLRALDLLDNQGECLTEFGVAIRKMLAWNGDFFWLGPARSVQEELGIIPAVRMPGPFEDAVGLGAAAMTPTRDENAALLTDTAQLMRQAYRSTKLQHAAQATLLLPLEYIRYRQFVDGRSYREDAIISGVFEKWRGEFVRLSARIGHVGFFKWVDRG